MQNDKDYQYNFSQSQPLLYDLHNRKQKALKTISVIKDFANKTETSLKKLNLLDIGCSTGIMSNIYSEYFNFTLGIDIDSEAVNHAKEQFEREDLKFKITSIEDFESQTNDKFDVITCSHIYEHVPDSEELINTIYNLLKPGGFCYFAAGNRYKVIEGHYKLPFLSYFPKPISNIYLKILKKGDYYYENHLSLIKLKKLVNKFEVKDYTLEIIHEPNKYFANELIKSNSIKHNLIKLISKLIYFFIPTYIWILVKPHEVTN